jgi:hypothetical protein
MVRIQIITCPEWGARRPQAGDPRGRRGRARDLPSHGRASPRARVPGSESLAEAMQYARDDPGVPHGRERLDRLGPSLPRVPERRILQGRWLTVSAIEAGHMVEGAHCPGQNHGDRDRARALGPRVAHGQAASELGRLMAWIAISTAATTPLPVDPHSDALRDDVPGNLRPAYRRDPRARPRSSVTRARSDAAPARTDQGRADGRGRVALPVRGARAHGRRSSTCSGSRRGSRPTTRAARDRVSAMRSRSSARSQHGRAARPATGGGGTTRSRFGARPRGSMSTPARSRTMSREPASAPRTRSRDRGSTARPRMELRNGAPSPVGLHEWDPADGVTEYRWATTVDAIRAAIAARDPGRDRDRLVHGVRHADREGQPRAVAPDRLASSGRVRGGHSVALVGASDRREAFRLVNSWGHAYPPVWMPYA